MGQIHPGRDYGPVPRRDSHDPLIATLCSGALDWLACFGQSPPGRSVRKQFVSQEQFGIIEEPPDPADLADDAWLSIVRFGSVSQNAAHEEVFRPPDAGPQDDDGNERTCVICLDAIQGHHYTVEPCLRCGSTIESHVWCARAYHDRTGRCMICAVAGVGAPVQSPTFAAAQAAQRAGALLDVFTLREHRRRNDTLVRSCEWATVRPPTPRSRPIAALSPSARAARSDSLASGAETPPLHSIADAHGESWLGGPPISRADIEARSAMPPVPDGPFPPMRGSARFAYLSPRLSSARSRLDNALCM